MKLSIDGNPFFMLQCSKGQTLETFMTAFVRIRYLANGEAAER